MKAQLQEVNNLKFVNMFMVCLCPSENPDLCASFTQQCHVRRACTSMLSVWLHTRAFCISGPVRIPHNAQATYPQSGMALQTGVLMFGFYQLLTQTYKGIPVAQLPFEPLPLIRFLSHRGLPENSSPRLLSVVCLVPSLQYLYKVFVLTYFSNF